MRTHVEVAQLFARRRPEGRTGRGLAIFRVGQRTRRVDGGADGPGVTDGMRLRVLPGAVPADLAPLGEAWCWLLIKLCLKDG